MSSPSTFAASLLDSTLAAQARGVALCLRERLGASRLAALGTFDELTADTRVRLEYLAEALALGHPTLYLQHADWLRAAYAARGQDEELLRAANACLATVLSEGLPPAAFAQVERLLVAEAHALAAPRREPPGELEGPRAREIARLLEAVLSGKRAAALACALELGNALGEEEFVERVLVGVQRELGRLWQRGEIHVGEEHLGSRLTEDFLARLPEPQPSVEAGGRRVVLAATSGDLHDIGLRMVARRFAREGWEVCFLGANVPRADLAHALQDLETDVLALSVTLGLHLRSAAAVIAAAHALEPRVPVLVGGPPFALDDGLWRTIGADAVALDALTAERQARALVPGR